MGAGRTEEERGGGGIGTRPSLGLDGDAPQVGVRGTPRHVVDFGERDVGPGQALLGGHGIE